MAKFLPEGHYCKTPLLKKEHKAWVCKKCGAVYKCKLIKGRLVWLQTMNGRSL